MDKKTGEMIVIPSREDSYERLLEAEKQFAEPDEVDDMKELWESQVAKLRRTCGF